LEKLKEMVPKARPYESVFARWFRQKGDAEEAGKWVQGAAEKYPKDAGIQLDYANWLLGKGRLVEVQPVIAAIEAMSSESTTTKYLKAQLAFADNRMSEAEKILEEVVNATKGKNLAMRRSRSRHRKLLNKILVGLREVPSLKLRWLIFCSSEESSHRLNVCWCRSLEVNVSLPRSLIFSAIC
jgi:uncharacterized protein HemY